jgi:hypothetical protein
MRSASRLQLLIGAGAILTLVAGVLLLTRGDFAPEYHADGEGPLASLSSVEESFGIPDTYSVALPLCTTNDFQPVVLDGTIAPHATFGAGMRYLGAYVRYGTEPGFQAIGSISGFPPPAPYLGLHEEKGFALASRCQEIRHGPRLYTELVLGFAPITSRGGGWVGIDVGYFSGFRHHVVTIPWAFIICGPGLPSDYEGCTQVAPSG